MSREEILQKMIAYLESHNILTLATVTPGGKPQAHTVTYVNEGTTVYFGTMNSTRKARNIMNNPSVAYTVDEDYKDWNRIQGIQMLGTASVMTDKAEMEKVSTLYTVKFHLAGDLPRSDKMIMVKIEPVSGYFLDNTKGFAYRDEVIF